MDTMTLRISDSSSQLHLAESGLEWCLTNMWTVLSSSSIRNISFFRPCSFICYGRTEKCSHETFPCSGHWRSFFNVQLLWTLKEIFISTASLLYLPQALSQRKKIWLELWNSKCTSYQYLRGKKMFLLLLCIFTFLSSQMSWWTTSVCRQPPL